MEFGLWSLERSENSYFFQPFLKKKKKKKIKEHLAPEDVTVEIWRYFLWSCQLDNQNIGFLKIAWEP